MIRAVLDTNVVLASQQSRNPDSPNVEIFERWRRGDFAALYSTDTLAEYAEKLLDLDVPEDLIMEFLRVFRRAAEQVAIRFLHLRHYPEDADDIAFVLCAVNGGASHLVSYDSDFDSVSGLYDFRVCRPVEFLQDVRS